MGRRSESCPAASARARTGWRNRPASRVAAEYCAWASAGDGAVFSSWRFRLAQGHLRGTGERSGFTRPCGDVARSNPLWICLAAICLQTIGQGLDLHFFARGDAALLHLWKYAADGFHEELNHFTPHTAAAQMCHHCCGSHKTGLAIGLVQPHTHVQSRARAAQRFADPRVALIDEG